MKKSFSVVCFLTLWISSSFADPTSLQKIESDLLIVGATESGWAAAIQAARMDVKRIVIVHDGKWFGGQYTEQALACVDENKGTGKVGWGVDWHPMKRSFHRSGLFKELMDRIEAVNSERYGSPMPGKPYHGPTTFRPAEAEAVFREMIQPYLDSGQIEVFWNLYPVSARLNPSKSRLLGLKFAETESGNSTLMVDAKITIDASDWGDVIQVSGAEYEVGPDPKSRYHEPSASEEIVKNEMNPITWAMIVEESPDGKPTPIPIPPYFDDRNYPRATHLSRKQFGGQKWDRKLIRTGGISHWPNGGKESTSPRQLSVFTVRRIVDGYSSLDKKTSILLNYMNGQDYPLTRLPQRVTDQLEKIEPGSSSKNIVEMTREQREIIFQDARNHSLGVLYHLQNFVHDKAPDKTNSFRNFRLSHEFGSADSLPPKPYIRESLRLKALYMMREQDGRNRDGKTKEFAKERFSHVMYPDGLFAWQFHYDFHRTGRTFLESEGDTGPWIDYETPGRNTRLVSDRCVFPARSLVPIRMEGLLGAQGNVGFSSIVSAAIRLHDQRIHIGQASGAMAAVCLQNQVQPKEIVYRRNLLEEVRDGLCGGVEGVPLLLYPWRDLPSDDPCFVAANRLSAAGLLDVSPRDVDFFSAKNNTLFKAITKVASPKVEKSSAQVNRGKVAITLWDKVRKTNFAPYPNVRSGDADGDGITDPEDALLFTKNQAITWNIEHPAVTPESDGLLDVDHPTTRRFDFASSQVPMAKNFERDAGEVFSDQRGFGWSADQSANARFRQVYPEKERDAFLFTRTSATWECLVENGTYEVIVCVGDSGHIQIGQNVTIEGSHLIKDTTTAEGRFYEASATVPVSDGKLTITIGRPEGSANTTLCWLAFSKAKKEP